METRGQGALEYLLLIGGAIVVAVVVVTLLLNLGSSGQAGTSSAAAGSLCAQKAAVSNQKCDVNTSTTGNTRVVWVDACYTCGTSISYPSCTATKNATIQANCVSN